MVMKLLGMPAQVWDQDRFHDLQKQQHQWMIAGETMTFQQFVDTLFPDPQDPHRTWFILRWGGSD